MLSMKIDLSFIHNFNQRRFANHLFRPEGECYALAIQLPYQNTIVEFEYAWMNE